MRGVNAAVVGLSRCGTLQPGLDKLGRPPGDLGIALVGFV
jgi:hypothetical protein